MSKRLNSPDGCGVLHYVTLNVRDRRRAFARPEYARLALDELRFESDRHPSPLLAYVVMPDHLHFIIWPQDGKLARFLSRYKPAVTVKLDNLGLQAGRQREHDWLLVNGRREFWQDGKHSLPLYSPSWIQQKINYIHSNPVRAGLVEREADYPWSSFGAYYPELSQQPPVSVDIWGD